MRPELSSAELSPTARWLLAIVAVEAALRGGWPGQGERAREYATHLPDAFFSGTTWAYLFGHVVVFLLLLARRCDPGRTLAFGLGLVALSRPLVSAAALGQIPQVRAWSAAVEVDGVGYSLFAAAAFAIGATILPSRGILLGPAVYFVAEYVGIWMRSAWIDPLLQRMIALEPTPATFQRTYVFETWLPFGLTMALAITALLVFRSLRSEFTSPSFASPKEEGEGASPIEPRRPLVPEGASLSIGQVVALGAIVALAYLSIWALDLVSVVPDPAYAIALGPAGAPSLASAIYYAEVVAVGVAIVAMATSGTGTGRAIRNLTLTTIGLVGIGWLVPATRPSLALGLDLVVPLLSGVAVLRLARGLPPPSRLAGAFGFGALMGLALHPLELAAQWAVGDPGETLLPAAGTGVVGVIVLGLIALLVGAGRPARTVNEPEAPLAAQG